jgi:phage baseplate assembly protein W
MSKLEGISVKVPLVYDNTDGPYKLNKSIQEVMKQNVKMVLLTSPGERIFEPDFGVGLHRFLFDTINDDLLDRVAERIKDQVATYLPNISLVSINFTTSDENASLAISEVQTLVRYEIMPFNSSDTLTITSNTTT